MVKQAMVSQKARAIQDLFELFNRIGLSIKGQNFKPLASGYSFVMAQDQRGYTTRIDHISSGDTRHAFSYKREDGSYVTFFVNKPCVSEEVIITPF